MDIICPTITMFDNIKLILQGAIVVEQFDTIAPRLNNAEITTDANTGEIVKASAYLDNLRVALHRDNLTITGSLAKFLFGGSNVETLDRHSTKEAIGKLSDELGIDVRQAKVTSFEFGTNFLMARPVQDYLILLGDCPHLNRCPLYSNTLYYKGSGKKTSREIKFYDKIADAKYKGFGYPECFENANLLRFEITYKNRLTKRFGFADISASTLYDDKFYKRVMDEYKNTYLEIKKLCTAKASVKSEIKTVDDAFMVFVGQLFRQCTQKQITDFVSELRRASVFLHPKYYNRLQKKLQNAFAISGQNADNDLIKELDDAVINCCAYT